MVYVYDGLYKGMSDLSEVLGGPALVFETGNCKPSGFSPLVIAWGQTGIADGVIDCVNGDAFASPPRITSSWPGHFPSEHNRQQKR